ncbi:zf-TFIIB domain-containing protein [Aromatoleum toluvorans]|uniref:zf-TFIIB domain-containing protein n=1 Tax=Aromatoleum toluvorans TaxID=92002 RepID=UPI003CCCD5AF
MHCPHCNQSVSVLSRAIRRAVRIKACPHCGGSVKVVFSWPVIAICFGPAVLLTLALRPWADSFASLPGVLAMLLLAMRLKSSE